MSTAMQTRLQSMVEALVNTGLGFVIALAAQVFITRYYGIPTTLQQDFLITCFFTGISILRGYAVRRMFNGWHHHQPRVKEFFGGIACRIAGHRYNFPYFKTNALYFCTRCSKEMFDRTLDDLRAMPPMSDEDMEDFRRMQDIYIAEGSN